MKKTKLPALVTIAILTLITAIFWVFFSAYRLISRTPPLSVPQEIIKPIDPNLNPDILDNLDKKIHF